MKKAGPFGWIVTRYRRSIAMAVSSWMFLSLALAFWPCCQAVADEHPPVVGVETDNHDHGMPANPEDPCRTWLDTADAALNTSPDILLSNFEPRIANTVYVVAHDFPAAVVSVPSQHAYHPSPPDPLPLYLRVQHLLI